MNETFRMMNQLVWRTIEETDASALNDLDAACKAVDGIEPVSRLTADALQSARLDQDNSLCVAFGDQMAAAAWVLPAGADDQVQAFSLGGRVRPEFRRRGIGEALLAWAEGRALRKAASVGQIQFRISNEALTEDANQLYMDYGYQRVFSEWMLERSLDGELPHAVHAVGLTHAAWDEQTARIFFQAYREGFRDRLGDLDPVEAEWVGEYACDEQFRPDLSRVVMAGNKPAGFVTCSVEGETGWISQIAVVPGYRRTGIAQALLLESLARFSAAGCSQAALHVNVNNPNAQALFLSNGFSHKLTRARYLKEINTGQNL